MKETKNEIVVYQLNKSKRLEVRFANDSVWLTQGQMAELFGCSLDNIGLHLKNVYACGELRKRATTEESSVVQFMQNMHIPTFLNPTVANFATVGRGLARRIV